MSRSYWVVLIPLLMVIGALWFLIEEGQSTSEGLPDPVQTIVRGGNSPETSEKKVRETPYEPVRTEVPSSSEREFHLRLRVVDEAGAAVPAVVVTVPERLQDLGSKPLLRGLSDESGRLSLACPTSIEGSEVWICAEKEPFVPSIERVRVDRSELLVKMLKPSMIEVCVSDHRGRPVPAAKVKLHTSWGTEVRRLAASLDGVDVERNPWVRLLCPMVRTDRSGRAVLDASRAHGYRIEVEAEGFLDYRESLGVSLEPWTRVDVTLSSLLVGGLMLVAPSTGEPLRTSVRNMGYTAAAIRNADPFIDPGIPALEKELVGRLGFEGIGVHWFFARTNEGGEAGLGPHMEVLCRGDQRVTVPLRPLPDLKRRDIVGLESPWAAVEHGRLKVRFYSSSGDVATPTAPWTIHGLDNLGREVFARPTDWGKSVHEFVLPEGRYELGAAGPRVRDPGFACAEVELFAGHDHQAAILVDPLGGTVRLSVADHLGRDLVRWDVQVTRTGPGRGGEVLRSRVDGPDAGSIQVSLLPGSYRLIFAAPDHEPVLREHLVEKGAFSEIHVVLPERPRRYHGLSYRRAEEAQATARKGTEE